MKLENPWQQAELQPEERSIVSCTSKMVYMRVESLLEVPEAYLVGASKIYLKCCITLEVQYTQRERERGGRGENLLTCLKKFNARLKQISLELKQMSLCIEQTLLNF